MPSQSYRIQSNLFLVLATVGAAPVSIPTPQPVNNYVVIDGSGSMYGTIDDLRNQVKMKLPSLMGPTDTLSMIVFSSRGEVHKVCEGVKMADFKTVYPAIDRLVRATNLTGFIDPLKEIAAMRDRVGSAFPGVNALWFMSDGDENQGSRAQVIEAMKLASAKMDSTTIVEFGRYANRALLNDMATTGNGRKIFAANFAAYEPEFAATMSRRLAGTNRIEVPIEGDPVAGLVFGFQGADLLTFSTANGHVSIPEDVVSIAYLSPTSVGTSRGDLATLAKYVADPNADCSGSENINYAYAALSLFAIRVKGDIVLPLLKALGDVKLVEEFSVCFGKERYGNFEKSAREAAFGTGRFEKGYDPDKVPADDAFTVFKFLEIVTSKDGNTLDIDTFERSYKRIGRARVDASENLTVAEAKEIAGYNAEIDTLRASLKGKRSPMLIEQINEKVEVIQEKIDALLESKETALKFVADPTPDGVPLLSLTFNEELPNISILTTRTGQVFINNRRTDAVDKLIAEAKTDPSKTAANTAEVDSLKKLPNLMPTKIFRNYAIIKDGWVNADELPVRLTRETVDELFKSGMTLGMIKETLVPTTGAVRITVLLKNIPVINRAMVKEASGQKLFDLELRLAKLRAAQKVYNAFKTEVGGAKKSEGFIAQYGAPAEAFLKTCGITEGGFNPKNTAADPVDFYMARQLTVVLYEDGAKAKLASGKAPSGKFDVLPSMNELNERIAKNGKMAGGSALMAEVVKEVEEFKKSDVYTKAKDQTKLFTAWIEGQQAVTVKETRAALREKAQMVFTLIVGQVWFTEPEFATPAAFTLPGKKEAKNLLGNVVTMTTANGKVDFIVGQEEIKVLL